jgi:hypothetical protein
MHVFLLFPVSLHKLSYQENHLHSRSLRHKTKLVHMSMYVACDMFSRPADLKVFSLFVLEKLFFIEG